MQRASAPKPEHEHEHEHEDFQEGDGWTVIQTYSIPIVRPEPEERRQVDPLRAYVRSRPVEELIQEICIDLDLPLDTPEMLEQAYEAHPPPLCGGGVSPPQSGVTEGASRAHGPAPPPSAPPTPPP